MELSNLITEKSKAKFISKTSITLIHSKVASIGVSTNFAFMFYKQILVIHFKVRDCISLTTE